MGMVQYFPERTLSYGALKIIFDIVNKNFFDNTDFILCKKNIICQNEIIKKNVKRLVPTYNFCI